MTDRRKESETRREIVDEIVRLGFQGALDDLLKALLKEAREAKK